MRIGVITFPGTLDDGDAARAVRLAGGRPSRCGTPTTTCAASTRVIVPGGFSYGDYLRAGAIASLAPIMTEVVAAAGRGLPVLGICNGFQILCEAGLLPGALVRNAGLHFVCRDQRLRGRGRPRPGPPTSRAGRSSCRSRTREGRYVADAATLAELEDAGRVVFRYAGGNPNGSLNDIAGVASADGRVVGLMPHPEHAIDRAHRALDRRPRALHLRAASGRDSVMVGRGELREPVRRLLLVEDDPGDAFLVGELLAEVDPDLDADRRRVACPRRCPQLADADCVLLDLNLPGYAGLDGLRTLLGADPLAAVCVLTGLDDEHLGTAAVAAGAQDYLVKGKVDGPLLIRAIRYAVERRRAETSLLRLREEQLVAAESQPPRTRAAALAAAGGQRRAPASRSTAPAAPARCSAATSSTPCATPTAPCTRSSATSPATDPTRPRSARCCGCRGARSCWPGWPRSGCCRSCSGCWSASATTAGCSPPRARSTISGGRRRRAARRASAAGGAVVGDRRSPRRSGCRWASPGERVWPAQTFALPPDWALLLYTDGLIEAREPDQRRFPLDRRPAGAARRRPRHRARASCPPGSSSARRPTTADRCSTTSPSCCW